jgi:hypothetical protein
MNIRGLVAAASVVGLGFGGYGPVAVGARDAAANTLTAGSSAQAGPSLQANPTLQATPSVQASIAAAEREAQHLLSLGRAPAAATTMNSEAACKSVDGDLGTPAVSSIVVAERSWRAHGSLASIASWLYAHPPLGLQLTTWTGATADGGGPWGYSDRVSLQWQSAQLGVGAAYLGPSTTAVCLDAQVVWLDPRPWPDNVPGPRAHVAVAAGCPVTDAKLVGVSNPGADLRTRLLPPGEPTAALVCSYNGYNGPSPESPQLPLAMKLAHQDRLGAAAAGRLAAAVSGLPLSHVDGGLTSCPAGLGTAAIMAFAYRTGLDVDIWVSATGCPFFANGYIRTGWITVDVVNFIHQYS